MQLRKKSLDVVCLGMTPFSNPFLESFSNQVSDLFFCTKFCNSNNNQKQIFVKSNCIWENLKSKIDSVVGSCDGDFVPHNPTFVNTSFLQ